MMDNQWAGPEGYEAGSTPIRYLIRPCSVNRSISALRSAPGKWPEYTLGEVEEHMTALWPQDGPSGHTRYFHYMKDDQHFCDLITGLTQRACRYFYAPDSQYAPLPGIPDIVVSDAEVARRIGRMNAGENTREARRVGRAKYDLEALPWDQQRALIEQIDALKREFSFEIIGPAAEPEPRSELEDYGEVTARGSVSA